jgi:hypothetical protein
MSYWEEVFCKPSVARPGDYSWKVRSVWELRDGKSSHLLSLSKKIRIVLDPIVK